MELLDFCRVKKITDKGFGFVRSIHYEGDIFFHYTQIKKQIFLDKLNKLKRGDFLIYFTSKLLPNNKRKVEHIWYEMDEIPKEFLPDFIRKIISEFEEGKTNVYDLLFVFDQLKKYNLLTAENLYIILNSKRILNLPTTIIPYLSNEEKKQFIGLLNLQQYNDSANKPFWLNEVQTIYDGL